MPPTTDLFLKATYDNIPFLSWLADYILHTTDMASGHDKRAVSFLSLFILI